jgi:dihydroorotate dehydrogenase electron transfer subunit
MLRIAGCNDPLLARPLALYDVVSDGAGRPLAVDVVYLVMGKMTSRLSQLAPGSRLDVWGPLGNGFPTFDSTARLVMVAGGIGQTPFLALGKETLGIQPYGRPLPGDLQAVRRPSVHLLYGARSADLLAGVADFQAAGIGVETITDDGSSGRQGLVTELLDQILSDDEPTRIVACGPERMLHAVAQRTENTPWPCWVSLETPMACGVGICFTCVARVRQLDGGWDYRRTCIEGPVFRAREIWREAP